MPGSVIAIILAATLITATISGIFGMAGGLLLMGVLAAFTPVATAMVLHGFIQIISNFSRAAFLWKHISWPIIGRYALGVGGAVLLIALVAWRPTQPAVFVMLGLTAMLVWIPKKVVEIDVERRWTGGTLRVPCAGAEHHRGRGGAAARPVFRQDAAAAPDRGGDQGGDAGDGPRGQDRVLGLAADRDAAVGRAAGRGAASRRSGCWRWSFRCRLRGHGWAAACWSG